MSEKLQERNPEAVRSAVSKRYAAVAAQASSGCCGPSTCCGPVGLETEVAQRVGYSAEELANLPEGANLGLGCGNPTAIAELRAGEVVLDLGSGAGIDAFLAARKVGPEGRVIGVDMTDSMLEKARRNAQAGGYANVDFRKGTIEDLPVESGSVDVIISNCVINLSPEKERVYREAFRVLKPGGRMLVSDIVLEAALPEQVARDADVWSACIGGAILRDEYLRIIREAGFAEIRIQRASRFADVFPAEDPSVQAIAQQFDLDRQEIEGILDSVTSLEILVQKGA